MNPHTVLRWSLLAVLLSGCTAGKEVTMIETLLREAKEKYAPDRRTAVFDVRSELRGRTLTLRGEVQSSEMKTQLLAYLRGKSDLEIVDSLAVLPEVSVGEKKFAVVSVSVANLRVKPDHASEMGTQALLGAPLTVLRKRGDGWYFVQTPDGYLGWTTDWIVLMSSEEYDRWLRRPKVIVTADAVTARQSKDDRTQPVSDLVAGDILALKGDADTHVEVEFPDGRSGFMRKDHGETYSSWLKRAEDTPESIVATAMRFLGVPYLWGGTSTKGMDCSGLTKITFFLNGVLLPRDASQQAAVGEPVELDSAMSRIQPGDLLFFGSRATEGEREKVEHVAISLGGLRYINASEYVRINSFNPSDPDYSAARRKSLLRVMRIIGVGEDRGVRRLVNIPSYRGHE